MIKTCPRCKAVWDPDPADGRRCGRCGEIGIPVERALPAREPPLTVAEVPISAAQGASASHPPMQEPPPPMAAQRARPTGVALLRAVAAVTGLIGLVASAAFLVISFQPHASGVGWLRASALASALASIGYMAFAEVFAGMAENLHAVRAAVESLDKRAKDR
jgi:hypothetical protein